MNKNYIAYKSGADYAGAEELLEQEWSYLEQHRKGFDRNHIRGIALSGGGIRSASFCLGVMQALAARSKLKNFDYLSSVSGGGYMGGALSWLWSGLWKEHGSQSSSFGVGKDDFPFGTEGRNFQREDQQDNRNQASLLRHLRQNGDYLTPGNGISALSFFSIILRSLVMGFVALMVVSGFIFSLFYPFDWFQPEVATSVFFREIAVYAVAAYLLLHFAYMVLLSSHKKSNDSTAAYRWRRKFESLLPRVLKLALLFYLLAVIHWFQVKLGGAILHVGGGSALLGALFGSIGGDSKWRKYLALIPLSLQMIASAGLMIFGLLVLADFWVNWLIANFPSSYLWITLGLLVAVTALARVLPINNISIHRYYRDRLMETFMPDAEQVLKGADTDEAIKANQTGVHQLGLGEQEQAPYHLINTNIILVQSAIAKFRGRGGDNFILSPLFCGSNATGWRNSADFCGGRMTLPSAIAISGAAANPDAGVAGQGLTTNALVSILMSIFNLRLGYWASNPDPQIQPDQNAVPSYLKPGFWEVLFRHRMNEKAEFVQLSDGGHFENLALYELFRRRARLIIVCDAGADPDYQFSDLANAIEKARVDFGVSVDIGKEQLATLVPATEPAQSAMDYAVAQKAYLIADVDYHDGAERLSKLIYIKTTLAKNIGADIHGYKRANPSFPDQSTVDQFFDEVQFEAYRELGWQIGQDMLSDKRVMHLLK